MSSIDELSEIVKPEKGSKKKGKAKGSSDEDMLSEAATQNFYYGCHNVQELLQARGYCPPDFEKKKKGKK
ncbi:unnamed protein product [Arctia plantaginis]|uniref:Uncharacterized protein n=1 Tax=Arctia plantaginis TaxID=874455 RepID=A0A8S0ZR61_ARCPL|nr:unnamed protein product [Arctia plantaginis]